MVVEKGNKINIPADKLTANEVKVEWQQNLRQRSEQYYSVPFFNKDQGSCGKSHYLDCIADLSTQEMRRA